MPDIPAAAVPSSAVQPRRRDRQATEAAFVAAAERLFAERGYDATTTKAIAAHAGYSEALIQTYFDGKAGLLLAVIQQEGGGLAEVEAFYARPLCPTLEQDALETLNFLVRLLHRRAAGLRIVMTRVLVEPRFREVFNHVTVRGSTRTYLLARLEHYAAAGRLRAHALPAAAELLIDLGFQLGFIHAEVLNTPPATVEADLAAFAAAFGRAFAPDRVVRRGTRVT